MSHDHLIPLPLRMKTAIDTEQTDPLTFVVAFLLSPPLQKAFLEKSYEVDFDTPCLQMHALHAIHTDGLTLCFWEPSCSCISSAAAAGSPSQSWVDALKQVL